MRTAQSYWTAGGGWQGSPLGEPGNAQLALLFGSPDVLRRGDLYDAVHRAHPAARLLGCSTAGEICGTRVLDDSLVVTAVELEHTEVRGLSCGIRDGSESAGVGRRLAAGLDHDGLVHALVISDGSQINGTELVRGLCEGLPDGVTVTGGISADGDRFGETLVVWDAPAAPGTVALLGFYGDRLRVGYGSLGGWDPFGPERLVTRAAGNVLYELDGRSALDLYKLYLGEHAGELPASAMLFPLSVRLPDGERPVVRTILSVDEEEQSMTFAGDVPDGSYAQLMKANFDRLVDGAIGAAQTSRAPLGEGTSDLALLISCIGRRLVLRQRIEEEVEGVREVLGDETVLAGFYSYGEISPFTPKARCELHNQTMTITTFSER